MSTMLQLSKRIDLPQYWFKKIPSLLSIMLVVILPQFEKCFGSMKQINEFKNKKEKKNALN